MPEISRLASDRPAATTESTSSAEETHARKIAGPESQADLARRASAISSSASLVSFARALFSARIPPQSGPMLPGLGSDFEPNLRALVTLCSPSDSEPAALGLTTGGSECSCSPSYPTPTASLFGCRDVQRMLGRRERCRERHGNGNGFGLTLGQYCAVNGISMTPALLESLMGFPDGWTDVG
jgi:hypothetical protein